MDKISKYRLGAIAIKYNVGIETLANTLTEKGFTDVSINPSLALSQEQYKYIDELFSKNLEIKNKVTELRNEEMTTKIINIIPGLVDLLTLNKKINDISHYKFP